MKIKAGGKKKKSKATQTRAKSITLKTAAGRQRASPAAASRPAVTAGSRLVRFLRTCWPPRPVNLRERRSRRGGEAGEASDKTQRIHHTHTHTHTHSHTPPQTLQFAPSPSGAGGAVRAKPAKVAPARRNPHPSLEPPPPRFTRAISEVQRVTGPANAAPRRVPPPPPTFQPERRPRPTS